MVDESRRKLPTGMQSASTKSGRGGSGKVGVSGFGLGPSVPVRGDVNATAHKDIPNSSMLPALYLQLGKEPVPLPA